MSAPHSPAVSPLLATAALVVIVAGIKAAEQIMVPFLLAAFIATIAATPVYWLHRLRVPVGVAIALVMLALIVALVGIGAVVAQSVDGFERQLPFYRQRVSGLFESALAALTALGIDVNQEVFDPAKALAWLARPC